VTARGAILFTRLLVTPARAGDVVTLSCAGRRCPFKTRRVRVRKNRSTLSLLPQVKRVRLRRKATFVVRITRTGTIGSYTRLKVVKRDLKPRFRCLRPGVARPVRCPES
jgi:hypothetical protein